jgi:hypothetical protein
MFPNHAANNRDRILRRHEIVGQRTVLGTKFFLSRFGLLGVTGEIEVLVIGLGCRERIVARGDGVIAAELDLHVVRRVGVHEVNCGTI